LKTRDKKFLGVVENKEDENSSQYTKDKVTPYHETQTVFPEFLTLLKARDEIFLYIGVVEYKGQNISLYCISKG
jgi:hypothetical protein